jgi:hypothetical protein
MWAPGSTAVQAEATVIRADVVKGDGAEVAGSDFVMTGSGAEEAGGRAEIAGGGTEKLGADTAQGCPPSGMEMGTAT